MLVHLGFMFLVTIFSFQKSKNHNCGWLFYQIWRDQRLVSKHIVEGWLVHPPLCLTDSAYLDHDSVVRSILFVW